ncbi:hypothetical protein D4R99_00220 [bacterium]|nr:MAG: hypothetical protein D4R99_00220 [bacterium]
MWIRNKKPTFMVSLEQNQSNMNTKTHCQKKCETLIQLMVKLPEKKCLTLKEAGRLSKVNLYKYKSNGSLPLVLSLYSYGEAFNIDPAWMIRIACMVDTSQITEGQALEILSRWSEFSAFLDNAFQIAMDGIIKRLGN